jgi:hypothetical protein
MNQRQLNSKSQSSKDDDQATTQAAILALKIRPPFHVGHKWGKCLDNAKNPDREEILRELKAKYKNNQNKKCKSNILAMVLLSNNKTIHPPMTMETPAMETKIPLALY